MCCYADAKAKREFLKKLGKRKTFWGWKELRRSGRAWRNRNYKYVPGVNKPVSITKRYDVSHPTGLHVYVSRPRPLLDGYKSVRVLCYRDDILYVDKRAGDKWNPRQIVLRKLTILKADWLAAGPPKEAVKR